MQYFLLAFLQVEAYFGESKSTFWTVICICRFVHAHDNNLSLYSGLIDCKRITTNSKHYA